jgi:hypothetical protein
MLFDKSIDILYYKKKLFIMINGNHAHGISLHMAIICFLDAQKHLDFTERIDSFRKTHSSFLEAMLRFKQGGKLLNPDREFIETKKSIEELIGTCDEFLLLLEKEAIAVEPFFKNVVVNIQALIGIIKKMKAVLIEILKNAKK